MNRRDDGSNGAERARWLAELALAIDQAQRLAWSLDVSQAATAEVEGLYCRLEKARIEVAALRCGALPARRADLDPFWTSFLNSNPPTELNTLWDVAAARELLEPRPDRRRRPTAGGDEAAIDERAFAVAQRRSIGAVDAASGAEQHRVSGGGIPFACRRQPRVDVGPSLGDDAKLQG